MAPELVVTKYLYEQPVAWCCSVCDIQFTFRTTASMQLPDINAEFRAIATRAWPAVARYPDNHDFQLTAKRLVFFLTI
jgi:hypothetical protein